MADNIDINVTPITRSVTIEVSNGATVSDVVYGVAWDGDTTNAPSKNALYDKIESIIAGVGTGATPETFTAVGGETSWVVTTAITSSHKFFVNGVKLVEGTDYTQTGSTFTFTGYTSVAGHEWEYYPDIAVPANGLLSTDIDTLAELNAIVTDATLIDTNDPRLSDARTPTAHTHTASEITDFDTEVSNNSSVTSNTAKISFDNTSSTRLADTSGTNTGDQDLSGKLDVIPDYILFDTTPETSSTAQGSLAWNTDELTLDLIQNGTTLQLGQEQQYNVRNNTGVTIADGTPVMATGSLGASGRITVAPMDGTNPANAKFFLGLTTEPILNGADGKVTSFGKVRGLNTSAYVDGDTLYISPSVIGGLTNVEPTGGDISMAVAFVVNSHTNGTLFVRVNNVNRNEFAHLIHTHTTSEITDFDTEVSNNASVVANTAKVTYPSADSTKVGFISVTQAVDLDTMESNIATNNAKVGVTTQISNLSEDTTPQLGGELDLNGHSVGGDAQTATGDGTTTIDWSLGNFFHFQFGAFNEVFTFTAPTKAGTFILKLVQDSVGSRTVTFPATVKWSGGTAPTLTTTATTGTDIITFYFDGTNYFGVEVLNFS